MGGGGELKLSVCRCVCVGRVGEELGRVGEELGRVGTNVTK